MMKPQLQTAVVAIAGELDFALGNVHAAIRFGGPGWRRS
jgi:hypothetical protein